MMNEIKRYALYTANSCVTIGESEHGYLVRYDDYVAELASANALIQEAKKALEHVHIQFGGQLPDENCGCDSCLLLVPVVETLAHYIQLFKIKFLA